MTSTVQYRESNQRLVRHMGMACAPFGSGENDGETELMQNA
ncbi:hypothetical protein [Oligoflexus tunisiensis]|nr:hypothetical protein [Oligoflexus tunisiensis]